MFKFPISYSYFFFSKFSSGFGVLLALNPFEGPTCYIKRKSMSGDNMLSVRVCRVVWLFMEYTCVGTS